MEKEEENRRAGSEPRRQRTVDRAVLVETLPQLARFLTPSYYTYTSIYRYRLGQIDSYAHRSIIGEKKTPTDGTCIGLDRNCREAPHHSNQKRRRRRDAEVYRQINGVSLQFHRKASTLLLLLLSRGIPKIRRLSPCLCLEMKSHRHRHAAPGMRDQNSFLPTCPCLCFIPSSSSPPYGECCCV